MNINDVLLSDKSKRSFLLGLIRIAKADGVIDSNESMYFNNFALQIGLSSEMATEINEWWERSDKPEVSFENRKEAIFFLRDAIQLCHVDGCYCESEKAEIKLLASEISIEPEVLQKIEAWVDEGMEWNKRGESLLSL